MDCSVSDFKIKLDPTILRSIQMEVAQNKAPLFQETFKNFYRVFTIAIKDVIWSEPDFVPFLQKPELQFLRHLRNASAHHNKFFWGTGDRQRKKTMDKLPVSWRGKTITQDSEGNPVFFDFIGTGDIFFLLMDISLLVQKS